MNEPVHKVSMFQSATLKLTVAYTAIALVICLIFSIALYQVAVHELQGRLQHQYQSWNGVFNDFDQRTLLFKLPTPTSDIEQGAHHIWLQLIYTNLLVLVAAGFVSYGLARRTLRPIEAAHEQQKRFTADVSHELRTPLTALKMETEVALFDKSTNAPALRKVLRSNLEEAEKLESLINNLLRLTQLESSHARETFQAVALQSVITSAMKAQQKQADKRNITVKSSTTKLKTQGDEAALTQLVTILLDNALKYSPSHSSVTVAVQAAGRNALITVTDQGNGIDAVSLPHIFDRFYRADNARTKDGSAGYGLGLSLAKMIIDLHGGSIALTSSIGKGTVATVELPLAENPKVKKNY
jgi:two-component system sensor histidine kinase CiaH